MRALLPVTLAAGLLSLLTAPTTTPQRVPQFGTSADAELRGRDNVEIANSLAAPKKGRYQLTVVARHSSGRLASVTTEVEVP